MRAARLILCCSIREGGSLLRAGLFPGAWCAPAEEIDKIVSSLPADKELVTYCWEHD